VSGRIVEQVLEHAPADLRPAELMILVVIAEDARERDRVSRFSDLENLTRRSRLKPGTIRNALSELTARALITPTLDRAHTGRHQEYRVADLKPEHRQATRNGHRPDDPPQLRRIQ
jgi:hypothetical protein